MNKKQNNTNEQDEIGIAIKKFRAFLEEGDGNGIRFLNAENKSIRRSEEYDEGLLRFMGINLSSEEKEERKEHAPVFSKERRLEAMRELDNEWFNGTDSDIEEFINEFGPDCFSWDDDQE